MAKEPKKIEKSWTEETLVAGSEPRADGAAVGY